MSGPADPCKHCVKCIWTHCNYRHIWKKGQTIDSTRFGPAKYLPSLGLRGVEAIERQTLVSPEWLEDAPPGRTRYVRDVGAVIGWDEGREASLSYVECSGFAGNRAFHGRPVHIENRQNQRMMK